MYSCTRVALRVQLYELRRYFRKYSIFESTQSTFVRKYFRRYSARLHVHVHVGSTRVRKYDVRKYLRTLVRYSATYEGSTYTLQLLLSYGSTKVLPYFRKYGNTEVLPYEGTFVHSYTVASLRRPQGSTATRTPWLPRRLP